MPVAVSTAIASALPASTKTTKATFAVVIPAVSKKTGARTRKYVSPSTSSIRIAFSTAGTAESTVTEEVGSPACTTDATTLVTTCTYSVTVPLGSQTFTVTSYDKNSALLSDGATTQNIVVDTANMIMVTLNGDVAAVVFSKPVVPACTATTAPLMVTANDADGNTITGTYSKPITIVQAGPSPRATATPNSTVSPAAFTKSTENTATVTYNGMSPGAVILTAMVNGNVAGTYTFAPVPKVCAEYALLEAAAKPGQPLGITSGSDGNVWAVENEGANIDKVITMTNATALAALGSVTQTPITIGVTSGSLQTAPEQIATGSDGNLWFTDPYNGVVQVTVANPTTGQTAYPANASNGETSEDPQGIAAGPVVSGTTGVLYYLQRNLNGIAANETVQVITTGGTIAPTGGYPVKPPAGASGVRLFGIAEGLDKNMWFTESEGDAIGILPTAGSGAGTTSSYVLPTAGAQPTFITPGYDGAMWFSESSANKIGRITTDGKFAVTEFAIPTATANPEGIVAGLDGNMYYAEDARSQFAQLTPGTGNSYEFPTIAATANPYALTLGSDGNIWFTETTANNVGYIGY